MSSCWVVIANSFFSSQELAGQELAGLTEAKYFIKKFKEHKDETTTSVMITEGREGWRQREREREREREKERERERERDGEREREREREGERGREREREKEGNEANDRGKGK